MPLLRVAWVLMLTLGALLLADTTKANYVFIGYKKTPFVTAALYRISLLSTANIQISLDCQTPAAIISGNERKIALVGSCTPQHKHTVCKAFAK